MKGNQSTKGARSRSEFRGGRKVQSITTQRRSQAGVPTGAAAAPVWLRAAGFAAIAHRNQIRKDGVTPYVAHCFRVAMIIRDVFNCGDATAICGALLHDTIEDTATDYDDIEANFGPAVADTVAAMTKNMILREDVREDEYDQRLARGPWQSRMIKLADAYDNFLDNTSLSAGQQAERLEKLRHRARRAMKLGRIDAANPLMQAAVAKLAALIGD